MTVERATGTCMARRVGVVMSGCALVASGLAFGVGVHPALAEEDMGAPQLQNVRLEPPIAYVTFTDTAIGENGFFVTVRERDNPDRILVQGAEVLASDGEQRAVTRQVTGIPPGVPVCVTVAAFLKETFSFSSSPDSNTLCTDPAVPASDVALENIRGNANPQASASPAYLVALRNPGGADATGITVNISTSGVAALGDQAGVASGWAANGFICSPRAPSGGETSALTCTGGNLKKGEATAPAVIVRFTGPGLGAIHAQISGAGDTNQGNNGTAYNLTVG